MDRTDIRRTATRDLVCQSCGRLPHPRRGGLTLVKVAAVFPVELLLYALATRQDLPIIATVALLAVTTSPSPPLSPLVPAVLPKSQRSPKSATVPD